MNAADRQTLAHKLEYLRQQLNALEPYRSLPKESWLTQTERRLAVERLLELCLQSVIDLSRLFVSVLGWRATGDERDALLILAERLVIPEAMAGRLVRAKGFRNILVHEYVGIDPELLACHLRDGPDDLRQFARCLAVWVADDEEQPRG